jgi:alkylated DNA repair protein (DNA oxidative demethylase)
MLHELSIPGLALNPQIVSRTEERELVARIKLLELAPFQFQRWTARRRVAWFGWRYDYDEHGLLPAPPVPQWLHALRERAAQMIDGSPDQLEQALITEYAPGAGIGWHRDRPAFAKVIGVSLQSPCTLRLRRRSADGFERAALPLAPGSAYALADAVRDQWEHSIAPLSAWRYSITFRTLRTGSRDRPRAKKSRAS